MDHMQRTLSISAQPSFHMQVSVTQCSCGFRAAALGASKFCCPNLAMAESSCYLCSKFQLGAGVLRREELEQSQGLCKSTPGSQPTAHCPSPDPVTPHSPCWSCWALSSLDSIVRYTQFPLAVQRDLLSFSLSSLSCQMPSTSEVVAHETTASPSSSLH